MAGKGGLCGFFLLASFLVNVQAFCQQSTLGREFVVAFMENNRRSNQPDKVTLFITANENTTGTIETSVQTINFSLQAGEQFVAEFDGDEENLIHRNSGQLDFKPCKITSSGDIAVHAMNGREFSSDGTVVLPVSSLDNEYLVTAHYDVFGPGQEPGTNQNFESTLVVVATEDDTEIEITPTARTVNTIPAGSTISVTLDAGQSYQIKAVGDLTGSLVKVVNATASNCKPLAVFGGNKTTSAGDCGTTGDHLFQQAFPLRTWGKSFIHVPLEGRTSGEIVKVLASQDDTEVQVNGSTVGQLDSGEFLRLEFGKAEVAEITTSKPSSVAVVAKSANCNEFNVAPLGDPSLLTLTPSKQLVTNAYFSTGKLVGSINLDLFHYITVIVPEGAENETNLNGQSIGSEFLAIPGTEFSYARVRVEEGVNHLSNPEGFIAYAYAAGSIESYAFAVAAGLENIQFEAESEYDFDVIGEEVACLNQEGTWELIPDDPELVLFTWYFGDGSAEIDGQEVNHTYTEEGIFEVVVLASTGDPICGEEVEFKFEVEVKATEAKINGPTSVCPEEPEITYTLTDTLNLEKVLWEVVGGDVVSETDFSITIDWPDSPTISSLNMIPVAPNGCLGESEELIVEITENPVPELPKGPEGICGVQSQVLVYLVPFPSQDKTYSWTVTGGNLVSGQNTEEIEVIWDIDAPVKSVFYSEISNSNGACEGDSKLLELEIFTAFTLAEEDIITPACPGSEDGSIKINPEGGSGEFSYSWSHDADLESAEATGLAAGIYEVEVLDLSGCGVEVVSITLPDAEVLEISSQPLVTPVSCSDAADGGFSVEITGGTAPYELEGYESTWDGLELSAVGFAKGDYSLQVMDSRGCVVPLEISITGPEELVLEFVEESPGCPGGRDGVLLVQVSGGTAPYFYEWENGFTTAEISELSSGEFSVTVTDSNGCQVNGSGRVSEAKPKVRIPSGFNPAEGLLEPVSNCTISYTMMVFDRWGELIYSGSSGWDGMLKGESLPIGVYTYLLKYDFQLENGLSRDEIRGSFTLIQ